MSQITELLFQNLKSEHLNKIYAGYSFKYIDVQASEKQLYFNNELQLQLLQ